MKTPSRARRLLTAALCGMIFFAAYGYCNTRAHAMGTTATAAGPLDTGVPFLPWTIVPYWSLDVLFVTSFMVAPDRATLRAHTARVLLGIGVACAAFLAFPLRCGVERPPISALWQPWYAALGGVDLPYNQAPSLHIILLLIVWHAHLPKLPAKWRPAAYAWGVLIAVSTLTTYQHGVTDVATGLLTGALIVYGIRAHPWLRRESPGSRRLARIYAIGAIAGTGAAAALAPHSYPAALLAGWAGASAMLVSLAYARGAPGVFAKTDGRVHWSAKIALAPVLFAQRLVHRLLAQPPAPSAAAITFGPARLATPEKSALLDMTAEHDTAGCRCRIRAQYPLLDLVNPSLDQLDEAADKVQELAASGPVHVVCGLGLERSALVVAAWHLKYGGTASVAQAVAHVRRGRPHALPHADRLVTLAELRARHHPDPAAARRLEADGAGQASVARPTQPKGPIVSASGGRG